MSRVSIAFLVLRLQFEMNALLLLKMRNNFKNIAGLRIAFGTEHAHKALGGFIRGTAEAFKTSGSVYEIPQNSLSRIYVTRQKAFDTLFQ